MNAIPTLVSDSQPFCRNANKGPISESRPASSIHCLTSFKSGMPLENRNTACGARELVGATQAELQPCRTWGTSGARRRRKLFARFRQTAYWQLARASPTTAPQPRKRPSRQQLPRIRRKAKFRSRVPSRRRDWTLHDTPPYMNHDDEREQYWRHRLRRSASRSFRQMSRLRWWQRCRER